MDLNLSDAAQFQQIRKLTAVSRLLTYAASADEVFKLAVNHACDLLGAEKSLLMIAADDGLLSLRASRGVNPELAEGFREALSETIVKRVAELLGEERERFLGVPLVVSGTIQGILVVIRSRADVVADHDEWFLSALADQAAIALEKTRSDEIAEFREQLIGIVGHDLRNPLSTMTMAAQLLLEHPGMGAHETELARKILRSAGIATRLTDQLLDLTRSRLGGGIPIHPTRFAMNSLLRQLSGEFELMHPGRPLQVDTRMEISGDWDRDRMHQLLSNLLSNAMRHGKPQSPVRLRMMAEDAEAVIEVCNEGDPISPDALPFVFEAYRKGRSHTSMKSNGLGLGLFIAQEIARAHGGSIKVTSTASEGTVFSVRVPREH